MARRRAGARSRRDRDRGARGSRPDAPLRAPAAGVDMALIRLDHVSKSYGDRIALSDVTLSFEPGEWVFVLGPSGAGKSTLLRVLALAEKPSSGRVEVDPGDVPGRTTGRRVSGRRMRRLVGVLGQEFRLLGDRPVYENIALACQSSGMWARGEIRDRRRPLLAHVGIRGRWWHSPTVR